jgi:hypothetical protein
MAMQQVMVAILQARDQLAEPALVSTPQATVVYPWGWNRLCPRTTYGSFLASIQPPAQWRYEKLLLTHYLGRLEWSFGVLSSRITFIEMDVDFEVLSGVDLPAAPRSGQGSNVIAVDKVAT